MTKAKTAKYPTIRKRVSQELYDFLYANGWPKCFDGFSDWLKHKDEFTRFLKTKTQKSNDKKTNTTTK